MLEDVSECLETWRPLLGTRAVEGLFEGLSTSTLDSRVISTVTIFYKFVALGTGCLGWIVSGGPSTRDYGAWALSVKELTGEGNREPEGWTGYTSPGVDFVYMHICVYLL